jgi:hypothetical protein
MENRIESVGISGDAIRPVPIRAPFRVLAYALGPFLLFTPLLVLYEAARSLLDGQWHEAGWTFGFFLSMLLALPMGWKMLRAARTGVDPDSEDRAIEAASSRALLEAVKRTERAD